MAGKMESDGTFPEKGSVSASMDADIAQWIIEFLLRQELDNRTMGCILSILPLPNDNNCLKKMILLKTIEFEVSNGLVSENILDCIEAIVELDRREGITIMDSMKDAYCKVAVDCTARFMREKSNEQSKLLDAVKRIWRRRIPKVENSEGAGLVSDGLQNWKDEFDAAVWDASIRKNFVPMNTRNEALNAVSVYVAETLEVMGPSFLELAAEKMGMSVAESQSIGNDRGNGQFGNRAASLPDAHLGNKPAVGDEDHVGKGATSQELGERDDDKFGEQATTSLQDLDNSIKPATRDKDQVEEGAMTLPNVGQDLGIGNKPATSDKDYAGKKAASLPNAGQELGVGDRPAINDEDQSGERARTFLQDLDISINPATRDNDQVEEGGVTLPNVGQDLGDCNKPTTIDRTHVAKRAAASPNAPAMREEGSLDETQRVNVLPKRKYVDGHGRPSRGGVKINDTEELSTETSRNEYDCMPTPEVDRVQEALRSSSMELQAMVKDPLPDALCLAETVIADMARKNTSHESSVENRNRMGVDVPNPSTNESLKPIQANEGNIGNQCSGHENNVPRPSLMEPNSTAHTYEWNDSIDDSLPSPSQPNRIHLPSPKRRVVSPLKEYEPTKRRRKARKWSVLEEDTLRTGVHNYGKGNWKDILKRYHDIFEGRTEVDLKDKWRNLMRSS